MAVALAFLVPLPEGLSEEARRAAVIGVIMAILWMTEAVPLAMGDGNWQSAVYAAWDATLAVGLLLGIIVLLRATQRRERAFGRLLARSSYATYLVHIPIVVYSAVLISGTDLSHTGRFALAAAIAVPASFAVAAVIRKIPGVSRVV